MYSPTTTEDTSTPEFHAEIARYLSYHWEWRVIASIINRRYGTNYTTEELKKLYREKL